MTDRIYVISCSRDLASMGLDRVRSAVDGLGETELSLDWSKVRLVPVIAGEKVQFQAGETAIVPIHDIKVPAYSMVFLSMYGSNGMGHLFCIGALEFHKYTEDRTSHVCMFQSRIKASVLPGDLLGQVLIVPGTKV
jgi:hypothetical protein